MEAKKRSVEIISTTMIKPSSPTPQHKRHLKLSLLDQTLSTVYAPVIFFHTAPPTNTFFNSYSLQKSLSKALELFYPFAGKLSDDFTSVECNDQGAYFLEARINCELSHFLRNPDPKTLTQFLPSYDPKTLDNAVTNNVLVLVQVSLFSCGGVAVAIEVSHKIADGSSVAFFGKTWAAISAGAQDFVQPVFVASSLFPPPTSPIKRVKQSGETELRSRRFVFNAAKLSDLKAKIQRENGVVDFNPSTVEAVSSLLFKCVVTASGPSAFLQMVNLRKKMTPMLGENNIGNFAWPLIVSSGERKHVMELHEIAIAIRRRLSEFSHDCKDYNGLKGEALLSMFLRFAEDEAKLANAGVGLYWFSALSSFRLYEADFGWGKPAWVTSPFFFKNRFPMLHSKSGRDIEVWATLEEKVMEKFESNEELLAFASVDAPNNATGHCRM